ncbi:MAG: sulfatase-like hydrolase/transferase [Verrucomicrobiaceae bacterium]|nr:sulfatase-like hydrolase/transferase [Verrucomicrobiaceae bacterium]
MIRLLAALFFVTTALAADRPNILWLTSEDNGPNYGCFGDKYAVTPNIDALAARGIRFKRAWSNAPVCAPARTCLISGRWAPADGAEHMRSLVPMPAAHKMYAQILREAGYYCTNNSKEDYNFDRAEVNGKDPVWDESSGKAHWKNRAAGQPFFAIFNDQITHESQIRRRPHTLIHDPAKAPVPPFQPDTPEVRHDWAQYYDNITTMDTGVGKKLAELEAAGLADDTIIMLYGDHGAGMPRFKRWPYNTGLQVGLIMYFPEKWKHLAPKGYAPGAASDELVQFIDLAPTLLSIAGVKPPAFMQGRAICGSHPAATPNNFIHGFRGRMDERYDCVRSTTDGRYVYVRQLMPHLPYGQYLNYMFQQATTRVWSDLFTAGKVDELQSRFWKPKPSEELYDLQSDPWETKNLVDSKAHAGDLERLRAAQDAWLLEARDLGLIPEAERLAVAKGSALADAFKDWPFHNILDAAKLAANRAEGTEKLAPLLKHENAAVRYWGVMGHLIRGSADAAALKPMLQDPSASVRIAAAEALGDIDTLLASANVDQKPYFEALEALNALDRLKSRLGPKKDSVLDLPAKAPKTVEKRLKEYVARLMEHIRE